VDLAFVSPASPYLMLGNGAAKTRCGEQKPPYNAGGCALQAEAT
jgi:hypothetical protein